MNTRLQWAILSMIGALAQTTISILGIWAGLNLFHILNITPDLEIVMWITFIIFTLTVIGLLVKPKVKKGLTNVESLTKRNVDSKVPLTFLGQTQEIKLKFKIYGDRSEPTREQLEKAAVSHLRDVFKDITITVVVFEDRKS